MFAANSTLRHFISSTVPVFGRYCRIPVGGLALLLALVSGYTLPQVHAQTEDIFADREVADPFAPSALPPLKENPMPTVDQERNVLFERPEEKDPAVMTQDEFYKTVTAAENAILTPAPESGPDLFAAGVMIARVGRPHFAKFFLEKSLTAEGTPADYAAAVTKLGSERIFFLVNHPILKKIGSDAAEHALEQAREFWQSPEFLKDALRRSEIGPRDSRVAGLLDLRKGGTAAIALLVEELSTADDTRRESLQSALRFLGAGATDSLLLYLNSTSADQAATILTVVAGMTDTRIGEELLIKYYDGSCAESLRNGPLKQALQKQWQTIPSRADAVHIAYKKAISYFERKAVLPALIDGVCFLSVWNNETQAVEQISLSAADCYRREAARWSLACLDVAEGETTVDLNAIRSLAMTAAGEDLYFQNLDKPVDTSIFTQVFPNATVEQLTAALRFAMESRHEKGGIYPVILLGQQGNESLLTGTKGSVSVLAQATCSRDRRLRFAALSALGRIKPKKSYAGSSLSLDSLLTFLNSRGEKKAIVASPKLDEALKAGNWISELGYRIIPATTGSDIIRLAQSDADIELVVMADGIRTPDPATVIQTLKNDFRTADIPVVFGADEEETMPESLTEVTTEPNALWSFLPFDRDSANWTLERLNEKTDMCQVPADVRLAQARGAAFLLSSFRNECPGVFEPEDLEAVVRNLLVTPSLQEQGMELAMTIPSAGIQNFLANQLGDVRIPAEQRKEYLNTFAKHLEKYGALLRGPDIVRLYDRYNASEKEDAETQKILSEMLDTLEKYTKSQS